MKKEQVDKSGLWVKRFSHNEYCPKDYFDTVLYYRDKRITFLESGGNKLLDLAPHLVEDPDDDE